MAGNVLITGATTGIGYELAKLFAKDKYELIIIARNETRLSETASSLIKDYNVKVKFIPKDLSKTDSAKEIFAELKNENISVDMLVNNAGFGDQGAFAESELSNDLDMIHLNITSLVILNRLFLDDMLKKNSGRIMNVASTAAFQPGPFMAMYYATKAFVLSFSEAVAEELSGTDVTVSCLCPGPTETEFQNRAGIKETKMMSGKRFTVMTAAEVALTGYKEMMKGKKIIIPGFANKAGTFFVKILPRKIISKVTRSMNSIKV
ncbi:MAG TPA: SDR family oxidoreductase [Ignavibacteria bacterium]|nr:SDR family oxidoreductase [Ignavibacteria bacterium]